MRHLFDRQLERARRENGEIDLNILADLVSGAYEEADRDRRRIDRSINLMIEELGELHQRLVDAFDVVPEGIVLFDADDRYVMWNQKYIEFYDEVKDAITVGARFEDALRTALTRGLVPDAIGREEEWLANRLANFAQPSSTYEQRLSGDRWVRVHERRTSNGGSVGIRIDITELKQREASFRLLFENNPVPMIVCDANTLAFVAANEAAVSFYGYSQQALLTMSAYDLRPPEDHDELRGRVQDGSVAHQNGSIRRHVKADGTSVDVTVFAKPMHYQGESALIFAAIDITERLEAQERIEHLAHHDTLTGLPNRASFNDYLSRALDMAALHGSKVAVLCIDLDRFKEVNDVFGHAAGDTLLTQVADRLMSAAGDAFVARLGGDEFGAVITDGPQPAGAQELASRITDALSEEIDVGAGAALANVSIGVAIYPSDGLGSGTLLANGDAALYRAKREGRGCTRFFDSEMDRQIREQRLLQHQLRLALETSQLKLFYQPQARLTGEIIGFEALLRWQHPERGLIGPEYFIALAEDSGLIIKLGERVLREACTEAASWTRPLQIAVNLSPVQFKHGDLPALVHAILLETGLPPQQLELEITEGILIDDFSRAMSVLRRLKSLGVKIAMDDFGTGYSSLSYLQSFPFDKIKIDQSFITRLSDNTQSPAIIRAVIGLARGLSLPVSAEGVETMDQLAFLKEEACDEMQGFLIGRPLEIEHYAEIVEKKTRHQIRSKVSHAS